MSLILLLMALHTRRWLWVGAAAILLYASSIFPVSRVLLHSLEISYPEIPVRDCPRADTIVVLSGFCAEYRGADRVMNFGEASERFEAGAQLWKAGRAERLWVMHDGEEPESRRLIVELERRGVVPGPAVRILGPVGTTAEEARLFRKEAEAEKVSSIILVTTAWHMPRAMQVFRRTGLEIVSFPADYQTRSRLEPPKLRDFFPQAKALLQTETFIREWMGRAYYGLRDG